MKNNVGSYLTKRSQMNGKSEAYVDSASDLRLTFEQLNERVNRVANMLLDHGIKRGDRVAILMMNSVEFVEVYLATAKIGGVVVPSTGDWLQMSWSSFLKTAALWSWYLEMNFLT